MVRPSDVAAAAGDEPAAADPLADYVATVPRHLRGDAWTRWRAMNPPPHLRPGARRDGCCTICGDELSARLGLCHACGRREFELLRALQPAPARPRVVPSVDGRAIREEWREYPAEGRYRPAARHRWFVVVDRDGIEVTRSLRRDVAERYL